ncbi:MAG: type IV toxin-antitoxin system AbiEi family antitoxin domain-containing protein [Propionibacteriales bacterium]|nr:type IV toxin-antitoxin system AbiEi family antitoxin domain-containing protein [Propionibacteriales bacterium]
MTAVPWSPDRFPGGPFTPQDLSELGIPRSALQRELRAGRVRRVLRGVYVDAAVEDSYDLRLAAVGRVIAPGHIACDRTAAWVHGIELVGPLERDGIPPVEVCRLRAQQRSVSAEVLGRNRDLSAADVMEVGGFLVTTPLRTALDLGCVLRRRDALAALDQFRRCFGISTEDLTREAVRYFRRRGVVQLRELIPLADPRAESVRESWTRLAIIEHGLPAPVPQYEVEVGGRVVFRLDHAYPSSRVAVEYDGYDFHHTDEQLESDAERRRWLRDNGWTVIVVRRGDFSGSQLDRWLSDLGEALRHAYTNLRW